MLSSCPQLDRTFFLRFRHRAIGAEIDTEVLRVSASASGDLITLCGRPLENVLDTHPTLARVVQVLLRLEHPQRSLLAYCHAAAVDRGGRSLLMPGSGGMGKSTLTGFLVANGFSYLGDDIVAIAEDDGSLLPLPSCLSVKSGSWPLLEEFFPALSQLPTLHRFGRDIRYVEPQGNYQCLPAAAAPSAILFPRYTTGAPTCLDQLSPLQTMIRLIGADAAMIVPATEARLAKLLSLVEQTPAFELTYSDLPGAMQAIEKVLSDQP